jgi:hypothetical protein
MQPGLPCGPFLCAPDEHNLYLAKVFLAIKPINDASAKTAEQICYRFESQRLFDMRTLVYEYTLKPSCRIVHDSYRQPKSFYDFLARSAAKI